MDDAATTGDASAAADPLSTCTDANFTAGILAEFASIKRAMIGDRAQLEVNPTRWAERLARWAGMEESAADQIRRLVAEVDRLRASGREGR